MPADQKLPTGPFYQGERRYFDFSPRLTDELKGLSQQEGVSLFVTLLAAFNVLLHCYSGQEDLVICTPVACRDRQDTKALIGYFNNVLPMRTILEGDPDFPEIIRRVRDAVSSMQGHQYLPFQSIAELPELVRIPLTRAMFFVRPDPAPAALPGLTVSPLNTHNGTANFDLFFTLKEKDGGLQGALEYKRHLFREETIGQFLENYRTVLEAVSSAPNQPLSSLPTFEPPIPVSEPFPGSDTAGFEGERERKLAAIWKKIFRMDSLGPNDDFFTLGGHSLLAMRLFAEIEKEFAWRLPISTLLMAPTVRQLAVTLGEENAAEAAASLVPFYREGAQPPIFLIHASEGNVLFYRKLAECLGVNCGRAVYGLQAAGLDGRHPPHETVREMASAYVEEIRRVQPHGPYVIGGICYGALLAQQSAAILEQEFGEKVTPVLIDPVATPSMQTRTYYVNQFLSNLPRISWWATEMLRRWKGRGRQAAEDREPLSPPLRQPKPDEIVIQQIHRAFESHRPPQVKGSMVCIVNADRGRLARFPWSRLTNQTFKWHIIEGSDHWTILDDPYVKTVAGIIDDAFRESGYKQ